MTIAFLVLAGTPAAALDYYVDQGHPQASDSNSGLAPSTPFLTINHAVSVVQPGDQVIVYEGVYREEVRFEVSGTSAQPIRLMAVPGEEVVVSGADIVAGWQPCDAIICKNNPLSASIYYVDLDWEPLGLFQSGARLRKARSPDVGWWKPNWGTANSLRDSEHITVSSGDWTGAEVFFFEETGDSQYTVTVSDSIQILGVLMFDTPLPNGAIPDYEDRYWVEDLVELISVEGEWALEEITPGQFRVYLLPLDGANPNAVTVEGARRTRFAIEWVDEGHLKIEGFEVRHSGNHGLGSFSDVGPGHIEVIGCFVHDNVATGIYGRSNDFGVYRNNLIAYNEYGLNTLGSNDVLIERNEVAYNTVDGVLVQGSDVVVRENYVHHHNLFGHPDNMQSYGSVQNLLVEDNLIISAGQSYMMSDVSGALFTGNVMLGSRGSMVVLRDASVSDVYVEQNTLILAGYGPVSLQNESGFMKDNVLGPSGHKGVFWGGIGPLSAYSSDFNLFYHTDLLPPDINAIGWDDDHLNFDEYVAASGHDVNSVYANPYFANVPVAYARTDGNFAEFLPHRIYLDDNEVALFEVGDFIEVDFDGVRRVVTVVAADHIEFDPPDDEFAIKASGVLNWKNNLDMAIDLTPMPGSPIYGAASTGGDLGAAIDVQAWMRGDFDGDGVRDVPMNPFAQGAPVALPAASGLARVLLPMMLVLAALPRWLGARHR